MDANERKEGKREGIRRLVSNTDPTDLFSLSKASTFNIATHNNGTHRIDLVFGTSNLLPYIIQCGHSAFH